jgi:anti-sigma28 factor (negative regulator of flagellin synthesis)
MRVEDRLAADAARQSSATAETQKTRLVGGSDAPAVGSSADRLQISSLAGRIRTVFENAARAHEARVVEIAGQVREGSYRVDTPGLSRMLASEALGGFAPEPGA